MVNGLISWWLLIGSGSLTCLPLVPPSAYFATSSRMIAYSSTVTHETRVEATDGATLFREPIVARVALTDDSFWLTRDFGSTLCRLKLPDFQPASPGCLHADAGSTFGQVHGDRGRLSYWMSFSGEALPDLAGLPASRYVRYEIAARSNRPMKLEEVVSPSGPTWCDGDALEYTLVRNGRLTFGGDEKIEPAVGNAIDGGVPCGVQDGVVAYGVNRRLYVNQSDGVSKMVEVESTVYVVQPWKGGWLVDGGTEFHFYSRDLAKEIAWGKKPADVGFATRGDAIFVVPREPGRD